MSQCTRWTRAELDQVLQNRPHIKAEGLVTSAQLNNFAAKVTLTTKQSKKTKQPNKTETEFQRILEATYPGATIVFEGIRLRWGNSMHYTADFAVSHPDWLQTRLYEVKGGHIWSRDAVRFKGCAAEWEDRFVFEMWQKKKGQWERIY